MLTFEPTAHVYRWGDRPVPNVTRIIAPLTNYDRIPRDALERAKQQGTAIHRMVELDLRGDLVLPVPAWMRGPFEAWQRFREETGLEVWASEYRMYHEGLDFAGTLDFAGVMHKVKRAKPAVIDVKRSFYAGPAIGLQDAGYVRSWNSQRGVDRLVDRFAVAFMPNGIYQLRRYQDPEDDVAFLACLQQFKWKEKHYGHANRGEQQPESDERSARDDAGTFRGIAA